MKKSPETFTTNTLSRERGRNEFARVEGRASVKELRDRFNGNSRVEPAQVFYQRYRSTQQKNSASGVENTWGKALRSHSDIAFVDSADQVLQASEGTCNSISAVDAPDSVPLNKIENCSTSPSTAAEVDDNCDNTSVISLLTDGSTMRSSEQSRLFRPTQSMINSRNELEESKRRIKPENDIWWEKRTDRLGSLDAYHRRRKSNGSEATTNGMADDESNYTRESHLGLRKDSERPSPITTAWKEKFVSVTSPIKSHLDEPSFPAGITRVMIRLIDGQDLLAASTVSGASSPAAFAWLGYPCSSSLQWDSWEDTTNGIIRSKTVRGTTNPTWNQDLVFPIDVSDLESITSLKISIMVRHDLNSTPTSISHKSAFSNLGILDISLASVLRQAKALQASVVSSSRKYLLDRAPGMSRVAGSIRLTISLQLGRDDCGPLFSLYPDVEDVEGLARRICQNFAADGCSGIGGASVSGHSVGRPLGSSGGTVAGGGSGGRMRFGGSPISAASSPGAAGSGAKSMGTSPAVGRQEGRKVQAAYLAAVQRKRPDGCFSSSSSPVMQSRLSSASTAPTKHHQQPGSAEGVSTSKSQLARRVTMSGRSPVDEGPLGPALDSHQQQQRRQQHQAPFVKPTRGGAAVIQSRRNTNEISHSPAVDSRTGIGKSNANGNTSEHGHGHGHSPAMMTKMRSEGMSPGVASSPSSSVHRDAPKSYQNRKSGVVAQTRSLYEKRWAPTGAKQTTPKTTPQSSPPPKALPQPPEPSGLLRPPSLQPPLSPPARALSLEDFEPDDADAHAAGQDDVDDDSQQRCDSSGAGYAMLSPVEDSTSPRMQLTLEHFSGDVTPVKPSPTFAAAAAAIILPTSPNNASHDRISGQLDTEELIDS